MQEPPPQIQLHTLWRRLCHIFFEAPVPVWIRRLYVFLPSLALCRLVTMYRGTPLAQIPRLFF